MSKIYLKNRIYIRIAVFMVVLGFLSLNSVLASEITANKVIELVNKARVEYQLEPLTLNKKLSQAAEDKAEDMIKNSYFAHTSPKGATPWIWFDKNNYDYKYAGENLAMDFLSAESQQKAWMESETHRKNILKPEFQEIGVAVKEGIINGKMTTIAVQEFGSRADYLKPANQKETITQPKTSEGSEVKGLENSKSGLRIKEDNFIKDTFQVSLLTLVSLSIVLNLTIITFYLSKIALWERNRRKIKVA